MDHDKFDCDDCVKKHRMLDKMLHIITWLKPVCVTIIVIVCLVGILSLFVATLFDKTPGLSDFSNFVSILLGVVATIVSLLSMFLSFYSLEKNNETEDRLYQSIEAIAKIATDTLSVVHTIDQRTFLLKNDNSKKSEHIEDDQWKTGGIDDEFQ